MLLDLFPNINKGVVIIMDYKKIDIDFIIDWCVENKQTAWLKAAAKEPVECKVYPKKKVVKTREDGTTYKTQVADKSQPYKIEKREKPFIQLKREFCLQFMPEIVPVAKGDKKPTMYDRIAKL